MPHARPQNELHRLEGPAFEAENQPIYAPPQCLCAVPPNKRRKLSKILIEGKVRSLGLGSRFQPLSYNKFVMLQQSVCSLKYDSSRRRKIWGSRKYRTLFSLRMWLWPSTIRRICYKLSSQISWPLKIPTVITVPGWLKWLAEITSKFVAMVTGLPPTDGSSATGWTEVYFLPMVTGFEWLR